MFAHCDSLTSIDLSNFDTSEMEYAEYVFSNSPNIRFIDISSFNPDIDFTYLFEEMTSSYGILKINKDIYSLIKNLTPANWTITY